MSFSACSVRSGGKALVTYLVFVKEISVTDKMMIITFDDDRETEYLFSDLDSLDLAYAITVHKSQGNEFDAVVMPVTGVVEQLAYRNLLYTAVTRAKKMIVLVGSVQTVEKMVANNSKAKRYSALKSFIMLGEEN